MDVNLESVNHQQTSLYEISNSAKLKTYILVGCVAAATLGLELIQTRILSFLYYNNVVYLTITIALLGLGISGVFVSLFSSYFKNAPKIIAFLTIGFIFSPMICLSIVSWLPECFPSTSITIYKLLFSYIFMVIPFLFSGAILGWVFMMHAESIHRLYCVDLVCSSAAVIAFVLLLWPLGGDWFIFFCSGIVLIGFVFYSQKVLSKEIIWSVVMMYLGSMLLIHGDLLGKKPGFYKTLGSINTNSKNKITAWTTITRIDINPLSIDKQILTQDGDAPTYLSGKSEVSTFAQTLKDKKFLGPASLTYQINKKPKKSLVIGVGGGIDVLVAKIMGAEFVTGVEINPATVSLIKGRYRSYLQWPNWQGVDIVRAEGRNYIRSKLNSYDTIVMSGIDTFSALNSGAYVLTENYLYTVEAVKDYLHALKPNGVMGINRWFYLQPRESLRLAALYLAAAKESNIEHSEQSIMVISEGYDDEFRWATTLIKKTPFTLAEVEGILSLVAKNPLLNIIYLPQIFSPSIQKSLEQKIASNDLTANFARECFNRLIRSSEKDRANFIHNYIYNIDPVYDDRPFFFEYFKEKGFDSFEKFMTYLSLIRGPTVLYVLLVICSFMCLLCILFPLWIFQRRGLKTPGAFSLLAFFSSLGFGYMMFEIGAMQLVNVYVGDPMYSLPLVLAGLLAATGMGSALSRKFSTIPSLSVILINILAISAMILLWVGLTHIIQPLTMHFELFSRAIIVLLAIIPVGVVLGIPFPTAIRELEKHCPNFIPWAWGVNGITSVLASIVAIILAMRVGFTMTVLIAVIAYLCGMVTYWSYSKTNSA